MEVQVNVEGDEFKPFRIPYDAAYEPHYEDSEIKFDISVHAKAIGMTGWDWKNKRSRWVAYDIDSIVGHKKGLSEDEIKDITKKLGAVDFITLLSSTSGHGLHVYSFLDYDEEVKNHVEHAQLARSLLTPISAASGLKLDAQVDTLGGNLWVWKRDAIGYQILKLGTKLSKLPNWRESKPKLTRELLSNATLRIPLDNEHNKLLEYFKTSGSLWWIKDGMLICHTYDLKLAHTLLGFKGIFETVAEGRNRGQDQNCFCFPEIGGGWVVRRHSRGTQERNNWFIDAGGWTTTYYNKVPSLRISSKVYGGSEGRKGYSFDSLSGAIKTLEAIGISIPILSHDNKLVLLYLERRAKIEQTNDGKLIISFPREEGDICYWAGSKTDWSQSFFQPNVLDDVDLPDHLVRHTDNGAWFVFTNRQWIQEEKSNVNDVLTTIGAKTKLVLGKCVLNNWKLVNQPFRPEYPGNREWNKDTAQLKFQPKKGSHSYWDLIFEHCGEGINEQAKYFNFISGSHYLRAWCAAIFQHPSSPLPYIVFVGGQNTGKSIFHEALSLLFLNGYIRANTAISNQAGFNGELATALLCIVEELDLSKRNYTADRIKDWVTGKTIEIHGKFKQPYTVLNYTHWIQCTNNPSYCPIFSGDTRITMIRVPVLKQEIPKHILLQKCEEEAPAFLHTLLELKLPPITGRLTIPVLTTDDKLIQEESNKTEFESYLETIHRVPGAKISLIDLFNNFMETLPMNDRTNWTTRKISKELDRLGYIKGKYGKKGDVHVGNLSITPCERSDILKLQAGRLV